MPTNANTFNSRITSETLEKKFRDTFPAQGGAELVQDLFAQGVIVPTVDFTQAALGSELRTDLQRAWDFSTGFQETTSGTSDNIITNPGFWQIGFVFANETGAATREANISITDGLSTKKIWQYEVTGGGTQDIQAIENTGIVVFVRSGDTVFTQVGASSGTMSSWYRQIADVYGNLTNPLGFTSS